ncbi:MAG: hypothetical protein LBE06_09925, partial [Azoarcus sp.]|nr:hypothetical protein [Azoarcus sp.]
MLRNILYVFMALAMAGLAALAVFAVQVWRDNPVAAQKRQRYVLRRMVESGFIGEAAYRQALDEPLRTTSG